jgi:SAM-dependent methyltransferase
LNQIRTSLDGQSLITPELIAREFEQQRQPLHEQIVVGKAELALTLDIARQQFESKVSTSITIERLATQLHLTRRKFLPGVWPELVDVARSHPVAAVLLEDPFTRWSFDKPRGYSGDAHLLDFIYGHPNVDEAVNQASPRGRSLYDFTSNASSSVAVRERRDILTRQVDEVTSSRGADAEVLTIAAGHLREAESSKALNGETIKRWVALDQDPLSVASIYAEYSGSSVQPTQGSVLEILTGQKTFGEFDLVYAAGLYDYLSFSVAVKLTRHCLKMLKPGGVFLFANFSDEVAVDGYMETFMNWALLLRSEAEMWRIADAANDKGEFEAAVWSGANRNIAYGTLRRSSNIRP